MNENWAEENLQTIRTLMERSAVYRRALAPIMLFAGILGVVAAAIGLVFHLDSIQAFCALWLGTAAIGVTGAFFNTRRQAIKDGEAVWSLPTRRVTQAALPPLFAGMILGSVFTFVGLSNPIILTFIWLFFYGCALHAAGFFMPHGVKTFGWIFIGSASVILCLLAVFDQRDFSAHWLMGFFFGVLHLGYGAYLYLTEKGKNAA
jgi:thiamine transporter ThiT